MMHTRIPWTLTVFLQEIVEEYMYILDGGEYMCTSIQILLKTWVFFIVPPAQQYVFTLFSDEEVSDRDLAIIARDYLTNWKSLRPFLGLSQSQEMEILQSHRTDYGKQKFKCLKMWKEKKGNEATYCALIKAAQNAKARRLADGVRSIQPTTHSKGHCTYTCI